MPADKFLNTLRFALPIARYTVLEAARNRLMWLLLVALLAAVILAAFLKQVSLTEADRVESVVAAAFMRVVAAFLVAAVVVTGVVREFNDKVLEVLLAKPMPRASYLLGKLAGFGAVAAVVAGVVSLPLAPLVPPAALAAWSASLFCELAIVVAAALFCVLTLNQVVTALSAVLGFYVLARSMAAVQMIVNASGAQTGWRDRITGAMVDAIAALLPALDRMTQTAWLVDGLPSPAVAGGLVLQAAIYVALLAAAALFDLYRQNL